MESSRMWNQIKATRLRAFCAGSSLAALLALSTLTSRAATWVTDLPSAQAAAKAANKLVLINFTGSDWCGWCIRLRNEVFSQPEFDSFAQDNLVLVEADFPRQKAQTAELKQANAELAQHFQIRGYPTLILLNGDGQ